jgi:Family of unknown function (DUF6644)
MNLLMALGKAHFLIVFGKWLEGTPWGAGTRTSLWAYPFVQMIHFTGLSIWLGTTLPVDVRLMGIGKRKETAAGLAHDFFAWNWIGFCILVVGGLMLFSSTATTYLINPAWLVKVMCLIPVALIWHVFVQQKAKVWGQTTDTPVIARFAGLVEILLWLSVITAAVLIPNY